MTAICPITEKRIDEKVARFNGLFTVLSLLAILLTPYKWLVFFLIPDFFIRGFLDGKLSYFSFLSKNIAKGLSIKPAPMNAGPKIFAARVGFAFVLTIAVLFGLNFSVAASVVAGILLVFSALEAFFGFCVACKLYPFVFALFYKKTLS